MKGIVIRSLSGIVYIAVIVAGLMLGDVVFRCFMAVLTTLAIVEFYGLANSHRAGFAGKLLDVAGGVAAVLGLYALASGGCTAAVPYGVGYLCYIVARLTIQLYSRSPEAFRSLAFSLMSQIYIALSIGLMSFIYCRGGFGGNMVLAMFIMIWLNDTGAFVVGSAIGRHKLFPRVSPKKSWEGFAGGVAFAIASAFLLKGAFGYAYTGASLGELLGMGAVVGIFATWGDLVESLIKRSLGVKDSGSIIPGHGGILDRIDSLLLVSPALIIYFYLYSALS